MLSIKSTAYPDGTRIIYAFGIPKPKPIHVYINEVIKTELAKSKNLKRA